MSSTRTDQVGQGRRANRRAGARAWIAAGGLAVLVGTPVAIWAWRRPIGQDPYMTLVNSEPTRHGYLTAMIVGGLILATLGLVVIVIGLVRVAPRKQA